jgi:hypothetical protein
MRLLKAFNLGLMAVLAGAGCNWNDFDTALDKAPVVSFDNGSSNGSLFVLPLPAPAPGGTVAARMFAARQDRANLAVADYDKNGKVTVHQATDSDLSNLGNLPVSSAATLGPNGPIILGTPRYGEVGKDSAQAAPGRVSLLTLSPAADGSMSFAVQAGLQGTDHYGISVAAGRVTGDATSAGEFVVVSDYSAQLVGADAKSVLATVDPGCQSIGQLYNAIPYSDRPIAVGNLFTSGADEIVLSGGGEVIFLQYDPTKRNLTCRPEVLRQGTMADFGASLAVADFDGDGMMDLAVGTPPDRVYVYFGPLDKVATAPNFVAISSAGSASFGKRIATFPGGQGKSLLMVADPMASSPKGRSGGGKVMLLSVPARGSAPTEAALVTLATLFDSSGDSSVGVFGDNLGSLEFDTRTCSAGGQVNPVPWASSGTSVLTFFNYPGSVPGDVRCNP